MKKFALLFLALGLTFLACNNNDDDGPTTENTLRYDGDNATGPLLAAGVHEAAARFPASVLSEFVGRNLSSISCFIGNVPQNIKVKVYAEGTFDQPGALLFSADITGSVAAPSWNEIPLSNPIEILDEDLWISVEVTHAQTQQSIGCDNGPADANGDWLFSDSDNDWIRYTQRTGESVNWNIRGTISD